MKKINETEAISILANATTATISARSKSALSKSAPKGAVAVVSGPFSLGGRYSDRVQSALAQEGIKAVFEASKPTWSGVKIAEGSEVYNGKVFVTVYYRSNTGLSYQSYDADGKALPPDSIKRWSNTNKKQTNLGLKNLVLMHRFNVADISTIGVGGEVYQVEHN